MTSIDKIYCIRFVKLPPTTVVLGQPFDIAISIVDDVGTALADYGVLYRGHSLCCFWKQSLNKVPVRLQCLLPDLARSQHPNLSIATQASSEATFTIDSSRGMFHSIKTVIKSQQERPVHSSAECQISVSLDATEAIPPNGLREQDQHFTKLVDETSFVRLDSYEENAVLLQSCSSAVKVCSNRYSATTAKVQITEVLLRLPESYDMPPIRIIERPSMHAIGDHLWHSSLVFASYILLGHLDEILGHETHILELGAGCGLVSLAVAATLRRNDEVPWRPLLATDLPDIVDSTLADCLAANPDLGKLIESRALIWGNDQAAREVVQGPSSPLTVLASDVLYNSDSHADFLSTLLSLFEAAHGKVQAVIAYRHRIAGDERFWEMARSVGFEFRLIYQVADIQLWNCDGRS